MNEQTTKQGNKLGVVVILLFLAAVGLGYMFIQSNAENEKLVQEKTVLQKDKLDLETSLEDKIAQFDKLQAEFNDSSAVLVTKKAELEKRLKALRSANYSASQLRKERNKLKKDLETYQAIIDSITTENIALKAANDSLNINLADVSGQFFSLQKNFDTNMGIAKLLVASSISAQGQKKKPNGKVKVTTKAKKVNSINVNFTINANKLADDGTKNVYLRIVGPDAKVLTIENKGSGKLRLVGVPEEVEYSTKKSVLYAHNNMKVNMDWDQNTPFAAGRYQIELYGDGYKMGTSAFTLQ